MKKVLPIFILLLITGCKSTKTGLNNEPVSLSKSTKSERIALLQTNSFAFNTLSAPLKFTIKPGNNSKTTSVNAVLKIIGGEQIQLSLRIPILGSEAARMNFTPTNALIIDRINNRYFFDSMENLKLRSGFDFDFYTLQALLADRLFIAGKRVILEEDYQLFTLEETEFTANLLYADSKNINYSFVCDWTNKIINSKIFKNDTELFWNYSDFRQTSDNQLFPMKMELNLQSADNSCYVSLDFSDITVNKEFTLDMDIPRNYKKITLDQMIEMIKSINK